MLLWEGNFPCITASEMFNQTCSQEMTEVRVSQTYLAARSKPVNEGQEGQSHGNSKDHKELDRHRLLSQAGQVLIPYGEELLLTIWMGYKLAGK